MTAQLYNVFTSDVHPELILIAPLEIIGKVFRLEKAALRRIELETEMFNGANVSMLFFGMNAQSHGYDKVVVTRSRIKHPTGKPL
jgi:hypothetical protein